MHHISRRGCLQRIGFVARLKFPHITYAKFSRQDEDQIVLVGKQSAAPVWPRVLQRSLSTTSHTSFIIQIDSKPISRNHPWQFYLNA